ncbi:DUF1835 domain-containing protein [Hoeflea alexandrii]
MTDDMRAAQSFPLLSETDISLNLDRQRQLAKRLRDDIRASEAGALARLRANHPRSAHLDTARIKLSDAQLVIAREAGLPSWPALKAHVEQLDTARRAIEGGAPAPDADMPTLHLRCGNDIEQALKRAGFAGDFLMYADPLCQGPVSDGEDRLRQRARFIASEYPGEDEAETLKKLIQAENRLARAGSYGRIVLWFEHDPYDQLVLAQVLARLSGTAAIRRKIELISLDRFPGISRFIGIGQLSPAALRDLYHKRQPLTSGAFDLAGKVWHTLCDPSPEPLHALSQVPSTALPFMPQAILRYLVELPSRRNGLSFTENAILSSLADGPLPWGRVFSRFMREIDPLPYHGDLMFYGTVLRLRDAEDPALTDDPADGADLDWGKARFGLTDTGQQLLAGEHDWKQCGPRLRFNGGVECFATPDWRWDAERAQPVTG